MHEKTNRRVGVPGTAPAALQKGARTNSEQGLVSRVSLTDTTKTSSFGGGRFTTIERDFSC
jgi:hypothetical protein